MDLQAFSFDGAPVRVVLVDDEPHMVARDVAERLGYADPINALKQHCRGVVKRHPIVDSLGRVQEARILSEPDVLRLIIASKLPAAERFERWVFEEVLPEIRRSGGYIAAKDETPEELAARALAVLQRTIARQKARIREMAPKVEALDRIADADGSLALTDAAKTLQIRRIDLVAWLSEHAWTYRRGGTANWLGYRAKEQAGLLVHKVTTVRNDDGSERIREQVRITPKGLARLATIFSTSLHASAVDAIPIPANSGKPRKI